METRNASFFEDVFPCKSKEGSRSSKQVLETINENNQDENNDGEVEPRYSKRARTKKKKKKKIFWSIFSDLCA